jgi:hypothetical protein
MIEMVLTFFLVFVVCGSAVAPCAPKIASLAIGLTIALDIIFGDPFTGAFINPARTLGPAAVCGHWNRQIAYSVGPLLGGALASLLYGRLLNQVIEATSAFPGPMPVNECMGTFNKFQGMPRHLRAAGSRGHEGAHRVMRPASRRGLLTS